MPHIPFLILLISNTIAINGSPDLRVNGGNVVHSLRDTMTQPVLSRKKIPLNEFTEGVLMLTAHAKGVIRIYDLQNREWLNIELDSTLSETIKPYSGYLEYENLVFRVVQTGNDFYTVIVNEENGLTAKISKHDPLLSFQRWDEHVLKVFSIDFDAKTNPVRKDTVSAARVAYNDNVEFFHPVQVKGDWMKIKWENGNGYRFGWVKWKRSNKLLLSLNYIP